MPRLRDLIDKRLGELEKSGGEDPGPQRAAMQERGEDYPAQVHTKPETTKTFSDGSVRTWDDEAQMWKVVKKTP